MQPDNEKIFFDMFLTFNDDKTEAYINIRPNSRFDKDDLKESIKQAFIKIKSSLTIAGIKYGIKNDKEIIENLKVYCKLPDDERKKNIYTFLVAKGIPPQKGQDSILIEHIKLRKEKHGIIDPKTGKIDHKNLGFSDRIVPEGSKIVTIVKPTKGTPGMDVLGNPIEPEEGKLIHQIKYDKKTILEQETEDSIHYISLKEGFLYKDPIKGYFIDEKVLTKAVDYKIGNIEGKEVEDSTVVVQGSSDIFEDSVKAGFKVEANKVKIRGNVGIEAQIKGNEIEIDGIVDKKATVEGKKIKINKFFGKLLKGKNVFLKEISSASAIGDILIIENSLSAKIKGNEILILKESRGSEIISDKFVFINRLCGSAKQKITIDPLVLPEKQEIMKELKKSLKLLQEELEKVILNIEEINEKLKKLNYEIEKIIKKYFKFSPDQEAKQKKVVLSLFQKGEWETLEEKLNIQFKPEDIYYLKQFHRTFIKKSTFENEKSEIEVKINDINSKINKINNASENAVIIIKQIKDCVVEIHIEDKMYKFSDDIIEPFFITYKRGRIIINPINKENSKFLSNFFKELISGEAFKIIKKIKLA